MDGFVTKPTTEEEQDCLNQASKIKTSRDLLDNLDSNLSLADSFLDFDSIKEFFDNISPNPDRYSSEEIEFGVFEKSLKMAEEGKTNSGDVIVHGSDPIFNGPGSAVKVETLEYEHDENSNCCIEKEMGKVSLVAVKNEIMNDQDESRKVGLVGESDLFPVDGSGMKSDTVSDEIESKSSSESEDEGSSSSYSSSGSSSDEEEEEGEEKKEEVKMEVKGELNVAGELEEGEIEGVDGEETVGGIDDDDEDEDDEAEEGEVEMVVGSDVEFDFVGDGDEDGAVATGGPIKSKNELQVLPPVPEVNVTLQPHHQMLPVGAVLSVLGAQVIVEGVEKHNPLNEGSFLWITESRSLLGLIDEVFGPVKNPYYMVRYNLDSEVPAGIHVGTSISFVQEFANHVLNDKNLYKKGYDASGDNDEEVSEAEFSDDEKEAEYRRNLKMEKRGMNDQKPGNKKNNRKKIRNRDGASQNGRHSIQQMDGVGQLPQNHDQHHFSAVPADRGNCSSSSAIGQGFVGGTGLVPQFPPMAQMAGFTGPMNGVWTNGMPSLQPQNAVFPNGFPSNGMPWHPQNYQQHPNQMPMMNSVPFLQQFDPSQRSHPNVALPGMQPNLLAGPAYAPWLGLVGQNGLNQMYGMGLPGQPMHPSINAGQPGFVGQNGLNQTFGMGFQGQPAPPSVNAGEQGIQPNVQPSEAPQQFNMGASSNRGRKPYHRGGGRFAGGRGRGRGNSR
ncbi:hypothetical protein LWI28_005855 [Acer negundo]|uniref:H/ACA ribonucleoprotein complex non-core subunit NAF1 n=1 Tax=Acer negundo TaxID=4023 RepID=A0AAD5IU32_ACENE|nr:hypothetical protein LWI28_005855 [Acer negundo]